MILNQSDDSEIKIFPNPTESQLTILGKNLTVEDLTIYNLFGQDVSFKSVLITADQSRIVLDLSDLPYGIYYLNTKASASPVRIVVH